MTLTTSNVMTKTKFDAFVTKLNLNDSSDRAKVNSIVIDEVLTEGFKEQWWTVPRVPAPLNTSCDKVLRPVPYCAFGANGWTVKFKAEWFVD